MTDQAENEKLSAKKGVATPTRKQQEAANKRPLVPSDRKGASKVSREEMMKQRERARLGLAAGEEKYLPLRDRGPQRKYVRDYVDARFSVGEYMVPMMFLVIILTFLPITAFQESSFLVLWAYFIVVVLDSIILNIMLARKLRTKFGTVDRGIWWYAAMRGIQMRFMRLPKPQVKRWKFPS